MPGVLGLDLGKQLGWGLVGGGAPRFGTIKVVSEWSPLGPCMLVLEDQLHRLILRHRPEVLAVARPFVRKSKKKMHDTTSNLLPLFGAFTVTAMLAHVMKLRLEVVEEGDARSKLVGVNMLRRKSKDAKEDVMRAWRSRGVEVTNDHEGDALCVALEGQRRRLKGRDYETTPLFDAAASMRARRSARVSFT